MSVLFPQTYYYKPFNTGGYVKGRYQGSYNTSSTFKGNIQPASQDEIASLNIGRETKGMIKIFADAIFNMALEGTQTNGDIIVYDDKEWEVIRGDKHKGTLLPHNEYFAEYRNEGDLE